MPKQPSPSTKENLASRGKELYARLISPAMIEQYRGKVIAIDVQSEDYEIADDVLSASDRLHERHPGTPFWFERIGHEALHRMGYWR
ncbi:MAG TPA: hypothetical protein VHV77_04215 [Pirellulales bacterium]|nr:hypothetical protein [Pirellulales bacterium]